MREDQFLASDLNSINLELGRGPSPPPPALSPPRTSSKRSRTAAPLPKHPNKHPSTANPPPALPRLPKPSSKAPTIRRTEDFVKGLPELSAEKSNKTLRKERERSRRRAVKRLLRISVPGVQVGKNSQVLKYLSELAETRVDWSVHQSEVTSTGFSGYISAEARAEIAGSQSQSLDELVNLGFRVHPWDGR